jgi:hypothetical protein
MTLARAMIAAEVLKLRRRRGAMTTALLLSVGVAVLYFAVLELRHEGHLGGARALLSGTTLLGIYFGSFAAILVGTEAGTADVTSGVFRDLAATGRSRVALFLVRIPGAVLVALACNGIGFGVTVLASLAFAGPAPAPSLGLILQSAAWLALATTVVSALAVGVASLTGSRTLTLTLVIGFQTFATTLLYGANFLGSARNGLLLVALSRLRPGPDIGTRAHAGSPSALPGFELPMAAGVAAVVIVAWLVAPALAGAWRTRTVEA